MPDIDPRWLDEASIVIDRLTPGMLVREPETVLHWVAQALQEAFEAGRAVERDRRFTVLMNESTKAMKVTEQL